jgi:Na+-driven multidrug efflux pump
MTQRTLIVCLAVGAPFIAFAPWFAQLFVAEPALMAQTIDYIRITTLPWAFLMASFPFIFAVVGLGDTRGTLALTVWSMYIGNLLPMVLVLKFVDTSTRWAAVAESVSHVATFVGCMGYYLWKERQLRHAWGEPAAEPVAAQPVEAKVGAAT